LVTFALAADPYFRLSFRAACRNNGLNKSMNNLKPVGCLGKLENPGLSVSDGRAGRPDGEGTPNSRSAPGFSPFFNSR
jgi:hypothetical protein